jgi:hypothetical protein
MSFISCQLSLPPGRHGATFCLMLYNASHGPIAQGKVAGIQIRRGITEDQKKLLEKDVF